MRSGGEISHFSRFAPSDPDAAVTRILILKLDHIGDILIAAMPLALLRASFPDAHLTIVCAPWNVGLVRRLAVADAIHASSFFSQVSLEDLDHAARDLRRAAAIDELRSLDLGTFDLAIDLRRDEDTRELLKLFDARLYAGFGDLATFSYLDIAVPVTHRGYDEGVTRLHLGPAELQRDASQRIGADGLHLSAGEGEARISIATDTLWAPAEEGGPDLRLLGAAIRQIHVVGNTAGGPSPAFVPPVALRRDKMSFGPGWLDWEAWGRWSSVAEAHIKLRFLTHSPDVDLLIEVQGHTSPSHPTATVRVRSEMGEVSHLFRAGDEPTNLRLPCRAIVLPQTVRSDPLLLRAGRYRGTLRLSVPDLADWEPVSLVLRGARLGSVVGRLITPDAIDRPGLLDFPFEVEVRDTGEPIEIELSCAGLRPARRLAIVSVDLQCMQARSPLLPVTHIEELLLDLAGLVALRHAPRVVKPDSGEVARRLSAPRKGSTAAEAVRRLRDRRGRGPFGLRRAPRKLIGIGIGANKETKLWPRAHFVELCRRLLDRPDIDLVFTGGPADADEVRWLVGELDAGGRAIDLCACCRIEDLGEMLVELDGYIGLDTGTTHFAGRVGVRTLAIFGAAHDPREWGPVGVRSGWVAADLDCGACSKSLASHCGFQLRCMSTLSPARIFEAVKANLL